MATKTVTTENEMNISKVQIFTESGIWKDTEFKKVKKGDIFRMFNGDTPIRDIFGNDIWQANENAYYDRKKKIYTADCVPIASTEG